MATSRAMEARRVWEKTASAPCSMVSRTLSCFSSLREMCSDTSVLLPELETPIVAYLAEGRGQGQVTLLENGRQVAARSPGVHGNFNLCRQDVSIAASCIS